jgi:hypothetical protein
MLATQPEQANSKAAPGAKAQFLTMEDLLTLFLKLMESKGATGTKGTKGRTSETEGTSPTGGLSLTASTAHSHHSKQSGDRILRFRCP